MPNMMMDTISKVITSFIAGLLVVAVIGLFTLNTQVTRVEGKLDTIEWRLQRLEASVK